MPLHASSATRITGTVARARAPWSSSVARSRSVRQTARRRSAGAVAKSAGEQLKRVRGAGKGAKAAAWRKDCDASGVKSFYDSGVRL